MDYAHDIEVVIPMYSLIEYNDNYVKASQILWQYYRDERHIDDNGVTVDFNVANAITDSFEVK